MSTRPLPPFWLSQDENYERAVFPWTTNTCILYQALFKKKPFMLQVKEKVKTHDLLQTRRDLISLPCLFQILSEHVHVFVSTYHNRPQPMIPPSPQYQSTLRRPDISQHISHNLGLEWGSSGLYFCWLGGSSCSSSSVATGSQFDRLEIFASVWCSSFFSNSNRDFLSASPTGFLTHPVLAPLFSVV